MNRKRKDVESALLAKGFILRESHHRQFLYVARNGKKTRVRTKTSHSGQQLGEDLIHAMAKQCRLSNREFLDLVDCPLDRAEYEELLVKAGELGP